MNTEPFRSARNYSYGKRSRGKFRIPNAIASRIRSGYEPCRDTDSQLPKLRTVTIWTLQGLLVIIIMLFVAVMYIYGREHVPALLVFITI